MNLSFALGDPLEQHVWYNQSMLQHNIWFVSYNINNNNEINKLIDITCSVVITNDTTVIVDDRVMLATLIIKQQ